MNPVAANSPDTLSEHPIGVWCLDRTYRLMTLTIQAPAKKVARAQASWRTLKPGMDLQHLSPPPMAVDGFIPGTVYRVSVVDSEGCDLLQLCEATREPVVNTLPLRWSNPEWKLYFSKLRKPKAPRAAANKPRKARKKKGKTI